jgi:hypothetical protein
MLMAMRPQIQNPSAFSICLMACDLTMLAGPVYAGGRGCDRPTFSPFGRSSRWEQQHLVVLRTIQDMDHVDLLSSDAIEDQVIGVNAAANAVVLISWN